MDPSEEKKQDTTSAQEKSKFIPAILIVLLLATIMGIGFYFYSGSQHDPSIASFPERLATAEKTIPKQTGTAEKSTEPEPNTAVDSRPALPDPGSTQPGHEMSQASLSAETMGEVKDSLNISAPALSPVAVPDHASDPAVVQRVSVCDSPALQLKKFYKHLDSQPYMAEYHLSPPSEKHFTALIHKLLSNPPQVTRESDDLYTILKNTAHFFRVSGKDNIQVMKGILDNEKSSMEEILADYYLLVTTPECDKTTYASTVDQTALYEYACFFLNTMGGRLYLFRRDSLSRMVVTYYAILLVDQANIQNNNLHGIALKPAVDMLIAEMETGGSSLKRSELYLDKLYDLKEKYQ